MSHLSAFGFSEFFILNFRPEGGEHGQEAKVGQPFAMEDPHAVVVEGGHNFQRPVYGAGGTTLVGLESYGVEGDQHLGLGVEVAEQGERAKHQDAKLVGIGLST